MSEDASHAAALKPTHDDGNPRGDMPELEFLTQYTGESAEALLKYEGRYRTDSLLLAFDEALQAKQQRHEALSSQEMTVLAVGALEREVNSGGYDQFFRHSSNECAPDIVEALERIGCRTNAAIARRAIKALGIQGALTPAALEHVFQTDSDRRDAALSDCDDAHWATKEDVPGSLFRFIKVNRERIRFG